MSSPLSNNPADLIGLIIEEYRLEVVLAQGDASAIFLARAEDGHTVVIRVLQQSLLVNLHVAERQVFRERFLREVALLRKLHHPHILPLLSYGVVEESELVYIIVPYLTKGSLDSRIQVEQLSLELVLIYVQQIAAALDYAHGLHFIHRNINPTSILFDDEDHLLLADFGVTWLFDVNLDASLITLESMDRAQGTLAYQAPEHISHKTVSHASDIYALTMLTYLLIAGTLPFDTTSILDADNLITTSDLYHLQATHPELPDEVVAVLLRGLAKTPGARYHYAGAFAHAFSESIHGHAVGLTAHLSAITAPTTPEELVGVLIEGYRLERVLSKGGASAVFLALAEDGRRVTIKVLLVSLLINVKDRGEFRTHFLSAAEELETLHHPNILPILSFGAIAEIDLIYIIEADLSIRTLESIIQPGGLEYSLMLIYILQIAAALDFAHERGHLHCNINPTNIFLDEYNHVFVADFGIAWLFDVSLDINLITLSTLRRANGTLAYRASEQFLRKSATRATDVYALAIIAYLLITGELPFDISALLIQREKLLLTGPRPPQQLRPGLSEITVAVLLRGLAVAPKTRYQQAGIFAIELAISMQEELRERISAQGATFDLLALSAFLIEMMSIQTPAVSLESSEINLAALELPTFDTEKTLVLPRIPTSSPSTIQKQAQLFSEVGQSSASLQKTNEASDTILAAAEVSTEETFILPVPLAATMTPMSPLATNTPPTSSSSSDTNELALFPVVLPPTANVSVPATSSPSSDTNKHAVAPVILSNTAQVGPPVPNGKTSTGNLPSVAVPVVPVRRRKKPARSHKSSNRRQPGAPGNLPGILNMTGNGCMIPAALLIVVLIGAGIFFIYPFIKNTPAAGASNSALVSITPGNKSIEQTFKLNVAIGTTSSSQSQIGARQITVNTQATSKTVPATGSKVEVGVNATGTLTFENASSSVLNYPVGTVFTGQNNVQVVIDQAVSIVSSSSTPNIVTVPAHVVQIGKNGNIAIRTIYVSTLKGAPCPTSIGPGPIGKISIMRPGTMTGFSDEFPTQSSSTRSSDFQSICNLTAFSGGQDAGTQTFVQQSDIDQAITNLSTSNAPSATKVLQKQLKTNEQLISTQQCQPHSSASQQANDAVGQFTVTVTYTCTGEVIDKDATITLLTQLLKEQARASFGSAYTSYTLSGKVIADFAGAQIQVIDSAQGSVSLTIKVAGTWVYQITEAQKQAWLNALPGKSKNDAQQFLQGQEGVAQVVIQLPDSYKDVFPTDVSKIILQVK